MKKAIVEAIERHRKLGESISIWQDGKVVTIESDKIPPLDKGKSEETRGDKGGEGGQGQTRGR